jgi:hypothetical protein
MFAVVSFDWFGSSEVRMHALVQDEARARSIFDALCKRHEAYNRRHVVEDGCQKLVDLLRVDDGALLYWGGRVERPASKSWRPTTGCTVTTRRIPCRIPCRRAGLIVRVP